MTRDELWEKAMELGALGGCHQRPDRSFFIGDYQFPVCARCTGVLLGQLVAFVLFLCRKPVPPVTALVLLLTMGADWFVQYIGLLESTNVRRLITGVMGGMGAAFLWIWALRKALKAVSR